MKIAKTQQARTAIYLEMCKRRGIKPEPAGCHQLWPQIVKRLNPRGLAFTRADS